MKDVDAWSERINTLTATVGFRPITGSVYSGVINEYHDVQGFILLKKPSMIRIIGQAPVVRTDIFDMASNGQEFRLSIPIKNKFIVGKTSYHAPAKNALENLRPQHILDALLVPPIDHATEKYFGEEYETGTNLYYVLTIIEPGANGALSLKRKVWFDRSDMDISRLELFGTEGSLLEDVEYANYQVFQGIPYPTQITLKRPVEGYTLTITVEKATFNQPVPPEKFDLKKPQNATLVELGEGQ